jgi:hypothetical protein
MKVLIKVVPSTPFALPSLLGLGGSRGTPPFAKENESNISSRRDLKENNKAIDHPSLLAHANVCLKSPSSMADRLGFSGGSSRVSSGLILPSSPAG